MSAQHKRPGTTARQNRRTKALPRHLEAFHATALREATGKRSLKDQAAENYAAERTQAEERRLVS